MVEAGREARNGQKHTLESCCSQQQVQGSVVRGGGLLRGVTGGFVERRKKACEGEGGVWVTYAQHSLNQPSEHKPMRWRPAWVPINGITV